MHVRQRGGPPPGVQGEARRTGPRAHRRAAIERLCAILRSAQLRQARQTALSSLCSLSTVVVPVQGRSFPVLVVDEATQATEPAALVAIMAKVRAVRAQPACRGPSLVFTRLPLSSRAKRFFSFLQSPSLLPVAGPHHLALNCLLPPCLISLMHAESLLLVGDPQHLALNCLLPLCPASFPSHRQSPCCWWAIPSSSLPPSNRCTLSAWAWTCRSSSGCRARASRPGCSIPSTGEGQVQVRPGVRYLSILVPWLLDTQYRSGRNR